AAADPPLDRNPQHYLAIGMRRANVKNLHIVAPACNLGVACAGGGPAAARSCGRLAGKDAWGDEPGQTVANDMAFSSFNIKGTPPVPDKSFFQVFLNTPDGASRPRCENIEHPGDEPQCENRWATPLLDDFDGDSVPSCDANCNTDPDDVAAAC